MARTLTASDRKALIRLASAMPVGSPERKAILAGLSKSAAGFPVGWVESPMGGIPPHDERYVRGPDGMVPSRKYVLWQIGDSLRVEAKRAMRGSNVKPKVHVYTKGNRKAVAVRFVVHGLRSEDLDYWRDQHYVDYGPPRLKKLRALSGEFASYLNARIQSEGKQWSSRVKDHYLAEEKSNLGLSYEGDYHYVVELKPEDVFDLAV